VEITTSCALDCPDRCSILCGMREGELHLRGNPSHPYTLGFTCAKIRRYPARLTSPHRIREPWIREGEAFRPAPWDEALDSVCGALEAARRTDPASILLVRGAGSMGASKGFADYVFDLLGARRTRGSLCDAAGIAALEEDAGRLDMNDPRQIDAAEAIVLWGKNPAASSIHTAVQVVKARRRGVPVLAVNPDPTAVERLSDHVVRVRPGADRFLALACAKILLETDGDRAPWRRAANEKAFRDLLARHHLGRLLEHCDVAEDDARQLAGLYGQTRRVATIAGWGLQRHSSGAENLRAIHALTFLAGTLGITGGGLYYNISSSRHLRTPRAPKRPASPLVLPDLAREIAAARPPIRFAWFTGTNFLNQGPDAKATREAMQGVDMVVTVDAFWTETARQADVVLPPALWLEEEDLVASHWHNTLGAVRQVTPPPEGCRTDFEILQEMAGRLGLPVPFRSLDQWLGARLPEGGPGLQELRRQGWAPVPWPEVAWEHGFSRPDGKIRLLEVLTPEPPPDPSHPFRFMTLLRTDALNSQLLPEEQERPLPVRLHPQTAADLHLGPGSPVRVVSETGELEGQVHLDSRLHPGAVACPRGGWINLGLGVNEATQVKLTDRGQGAAYYATAVRLERVT
jgi:anaerobic selenocysteine-containing dehydrogenase